MFRVGTGVFSRHAVARAITVAGLVGVVVASVVGGLSAQPAVAAPGINKQINFQGKLVNTNGTNIANGTYNLEFKIYTGGTGCVSGGSSPCGGTLAWTEDRLRNNSDGVVVTDGIFQVNLGSVTSLPASFNNDTVWLSINLGNTNATCTPFSSCSGDGEMLPFIRFTAAPYAMNSDLLDGLDSADFAQLSPGSAQSGFLNVTGNVTSGAVVSAATSLQAPLVDTATAVALNIGTTTASSVTIGRTTTPFLVQGNSSSTFTATSGGNTTTVGFTTPTGANSIVFPDAGGTVCTTVSTTCGAVYGAAGSFLAKDSPDTSSFAVTAANYLYGFTNNNGTPTTGGVLKLDNSANTGSTLLVTGSGNPAAGAAFIVVNDTNGTPSGNLVDLQISGTSKLAINTAGTITQASGATINGQTITATASFTGTVTAATSLIAPLVQTADGTGASAALTVRTGNATTSGNTGALTLASGNATSGNSGNVSLDAGTASGTTGTVSIGTGNASSVTIGKTTTNFTLQGASGASGSVISATNGGNTTTVKFTDPTGANAILFPNAGGTLCTTTASTCNTTYQPYSATGYLLKDAQDTSSASATGALLAFRNTSSAGNRVLDLTNDGTGTTLNIAANANPGAGAALLKVNNAASSPSGNLLDLQRGGTSVLSVAQSGAFAQTVNTASTDAHAITAASLTTGAVLKTTSTNTNTTNVSVSAVQFNPTNAQSTNAVAGSNLISGLDVQFTQNPSVAGNNETVANLVVKQNNSSPTDATVASILNLANNDDTAGSSSQITVTDGLKINGANITNGINLSGTFGTSLITSSNFSVSQAGAIVGVGVNSGTGLLQGTGGLTLTGTTSINASAGTATTSIGTGTTTGLVSIGGGSGTFALNTTNIDIDNAGAITGATAITSSGTITFSGLTNNGPVYTTTGGVLNSEVNLSVTRGGTGVGTTTAYGILAGGTTATGAFQNVGTGTTGQLLKSNGNAALASWVNNTAANVCSDCIVQAPTTTAQNTIAPTTNSVVALTVKGTTGTAANVLEVFDSTGTPARQAYFNSAGSLNVAQVIQPTSNNAVDLGVSGTGFRTGYFGTSVLTPLLDTPSGTTTLNVGTTNATAGINLNQDTTLATGKDLILQGAAAYITNNQTQTQAEAFGLNAVVSDQLTVAVGYSAEAHNSRSIAVGHNADAAGDDGIALGQDAQVLANGGVAVGSGSRSGFGGVAVGTGAKASGVNNSTAIGNGSDATGASDSIALGAGALVTAANQLVVGSSTSSISQVVIGSGVTAAAPVAVTIQGTGSSGAAAGAAVTVQGGAAGASAGSAGGGVTIAGANGSSTGTGGDGGNIALTAGNGQGSGGSRNGGSITLTTGSASGGTAGSINLNSATVATNQTNIALLNTTATTVNAFGAASSINLGASSGTVTLGNTGGTALLRTTTGALTITSAAAATWSTGAGALTVDAAAGLNLGTVNATGVTLGKTATTTTVNGNLTVGTAGSNQFTNNSSTLNTALALGDLANGNMGASAGATVDVYTAFTISPTASGRSYTVLSPTSAAAGRVIYVSNINATNSFTLVGNSSVLINPGVTATMVWNGAAWTFAGTDASGLQSAYNNSGTTDPQIQLSNTNGGIKIRDASSSTITNLLQIANSGGTVSYLTVTSAATNLTGNLTFTKEANRTIQVSDSTTAATAGGNLTIQAAAGNTSGLGGNLVLNAGAGGNAAAGGQVQITAGAAGGGNNNGGQAYLQGGTASGTGTGGTASLLGGSASATAGSIGGAVALTGGNGATGSGATAGGAGGAVGITGGNGGAGSGSNSSGSNGAAVNINGGAGGNATGSGTNGNGGNVAITGGTSGTGGSTGTPTGGAVSLQGGNAAAVAGAKGGAISISSGIGSSTGTGGAGGDITITAGAANGSGANAGGNIFLTAGNASSTGTPGVVSIDQPVFTATTETASGASYALAQANVDGFSTIVVTESTSNGTVTVPAPRNTTTGRVVYITAAGSNSFTLSPSGGPSVNMSPGNTTMLVWNNALTQWTASASASSLQQAYNNTSTSPASIVTTSATKNVLFQAGVGFDNANLFQVGNSAGAQLFTVDTTNTASGSTNKSIDGGVESALGTTWQAFGTGSSVARDTTNYASGTGAVAITATTSGSAGGKNNLGGGSEHQHYVHCELLG